ncbi:MAG: ATP-binding protein, partial [Clostridium sp.]|nr:ATP-binding protein [Clostridium sp.]
LSIVFIGLFCALFSSDGIYMSLYKISTSFYLFSTCVSLGVDIARWFFDGNIWVDIIVRFVIMFIMLFVTAFKIRKPFLEGLDFLIEEMDAFIIVLILMTTYVGTIMAYWPNMQGFSVFNMTRAIYVFSIIGILQYTVFRMYFHLGKERYYRSEKELLELNEQLLSHQLEIVRESEEQAARVRHDIRHHCLLMEEYIKKGEKEKFFDYIKQYREDIESTNVQHICANEAADSILSVYANHAGQENIIVSMDVKLSRNIPVRDIDLVAILANVFENAIHGCIHSGKTEKEIKIRINQKGSKIVIQFINTCANDIKFRNGMPESEHGIGVKSIVRAVSEYHGEIDFELDDGMFVTKILMNYPNISQ